MVYQNKNWQLARINRDNCDTFLDIKDKSTLVRSDIAQAIEIFPNP